MDGEYQFPTNRLRPLRDPTKTPVVLVACGSFSPITILHLRMFEMARDHARQPHPPHLHPSSSPSSSPTPSPSFEIVGGYLSLVNDAYKKRGLAPAVHRFNMCMLACGRTSDWIMVDPWEARQDEYVPTARVLDHFWEELNDKRGGVEVRPREGLRGKKGLAGSRPGSRRGSEGQKGGEGMEKGKGREEVRNGQIREVGVNGTASNSRPGTGETEKEGAAPGHDVERRQVKIILLAGTDLVQSMAEPGVWTDQDLHHILGRYGIYVIERPESNLDLTSFLSSSPSSPLTQHLSQIYLVPQPVRNDVSSTKVRAFLQSGMSVQYLTPGPVVKYIKGHGLFRGKRRKRDEVDGGDKTVDGNGAVVFSQADLVQTPPPVDHALLEKLWKEAWNEQEEASSEDEDDWGAGGEDDDEEAAVVVDGVLRTEGDSTPSGSGSGSGSEVEREKGEAGGQTGKKEGT